MTKKRSRLSGVGVKAGDRPGRPDQPTREFPSRAAILAFIAGENGAAMKATPARIGKREIARAFGIKGADRIALKRVLKELESDGAIARGRGSLAKPGHLPPVVAVEIFARDSDGELIAKPIAWDEAIEGAIPRILIMVPRRAKLGSPTPGVGDRALARTEPNRDAGPREPAYRGRVIKLLPRARSPVLGIFHRVPGGGGRIIPVDKKAIGRELVVADGGEGEAQDGDLVAVETVRLGRFTPLAARVKERLGSLASERSVSLIAIHAHGIPHVFGPMALAEAEKARPASLQGREDWRKLPLLTIDPPDAKDHDDAVHAERDTDPTNSGGFLVTVAIADVAAYVRPGLGLDREALERGNSVYFPERVVPMLPERISNDLCSLRPGEDRPALAVRLVIAADGHKKSHTFHRIMMRSSAKLTYEQAQSAIDGKPDDTTGPLIEPVLKSLWAAYRSIKTARDQRGPLELDLPERKLVLRQDGTVEQITVPARLDAHRLIEELMILANVAAAETLEDNRRPLVYRVHDEPSVEKLKALSEFLASMGIKLAKGQALRPREFNAVLARVKGTDSEHLINEVVLRSQSQAEYTSQNYGHFGLNLRRYAHFTSPIRRYADLIVHRALIRAMQLGDDGGAPATVAELDEIAARLSAAERRAMAAERDTADRLIAAFLSEKIGATFRGRIAGVTRSGLFVKLDETGADGFIPAATLGDDYFRHDEASHAMIGSRTGETHRLGDVVEVRLIEAAPFAGALRFELLSEGRYGSAGGRLAKSSKQRRGNKPVDRNKSPARRPAKAAPSAAKRDR